MKFFRQWFKPRTTQPDYKTRVAGYLQTLPRCGAEVMVLGPRASDPCSHCQVTLAATDLLRWAERHAASSWHSNEAVQIATQALPLWLQSADAASTEHITELPALMQQVVVPYLDEFVYHHNLFRNGPVAVTCLACNAVVQDMAREKIDAGWENGFLVFNTQWTCPQGHLVYKQEHEMHIQRRRRVASAAD